MSVATGLEAHPFIAYCAQDIATELQQVQVSTFLYICKVLNYFGWPALHMLAAACTSLISQLPSL